jgi:hypothetical protein
VDGKRIGRIRMRVIPDASAASTTARLCHLAALEALCKKTHVKRHSRRRAKLRIRNCMPV